MSRQKRGGTLGVIVASAVTIVLIGICLFFVAQILGGGRELQNAIDAGNLNVAKQALTKPAVTLTAAQEDLFGAIGGDGAGADSKQIDLLSYNRLFGESLLITANAVRDGRPDNVARDHAKEVADLLQNGANSVADDLSTRLESKSGNVLFSQFDQTAQGNSVRMLGKDSNVDRQDDAYDVAFLEQTNTDNQATNVEVPAVLESLFSAPVQTQLFTKKKDGNGVEHTFLRGYTAPIFGAGFPSPIGVPLQPFEQPHHVSKKTFDAQTDRTNDLVGTRVPPNAFQSRANSNVTVQGNNVVGSLACAQAAAGNSPIGGVRPPTSNLALPFGYIEVVNGTLDNTKKIVPGTNVNGPFPGLDHVLNNELLTGIKVSGNAFGTDTLPTNAKGEGPMTAWADYNYNDSLPAGDPNKRAGMPQPALDGVFNLAGNAASVADAKSIKFAPAADGKSASLSSDHVCTDGNVTGFDDTSIDPVCKDLWQGTPGKFDKAFHGTPDGTDPYRTTKGTASDLISAECAKCQLQAKFNTCTDLTVNCNPTGLRTWTRMADDNAGPNSIARAPFGNCKVSDNGTIKELGDFVSAGFGSTMEKHIRDRMNQIKPGFTAADENNVFTTKIPNGTRMFIYLTGNPLKSDAKFVCTTTPPTSEVFGDVDPDGRNDQRTFGPYNIVANSNNDGSGFINPHHEGGIHDILYRDHPTAGATAVDTATFFFSSGYRGLLGRAQFTNAAQGTAVGFCKPD